MSEEVRKIGILTSGGDSPGMNAAVVSVARNASQKGLQLMGIKRGYNGLLGLSDNPDDDIEYLDLETVLDIMDMRGTYLRTARCSAFMNPEVRARAAEELLRGRPLDRAAIRSAQEALSLDLDPMDDPTLSGATRLHLARVLLGRILARLAEQMD